MIEIKTYIFYYFVKYMNYWVLYTMDYEMRQSIIRISMEYENLLTIFVSYIFLINYGFVKCWNDNILAIQLCPFKSWPLRGIS